MTGDALTESQVLYLFHAPGADRERAGREVCEALAEANKRIFARSETGESYLDSWFLASPDQRHIDGNDLETPEAILTAADQLAAPGCHSILVGFNTVAARDVDAATVARRAMAQVHHLERYAPTEVGDSAPDGDRHLVDAVIARAARLTITERADLAAAGRAARAAVGFQSLSDYDRGLGARIAPPAQVLAVNQAWSRAIAAANCAGDPDLSFAVGAAAGALANRAHLNQWPSWNDPDYYALTGPWRTAVGPLHRGDVAADPEGEADPEVTVRTQSELDAAVLAKGHDPELTVVIDSPPNKRLDVSGPIALNVIGESLVHVSAGAEVYASGNARLVAVTGAGVVDARENVVVVAHAGVEVDLYGEASCHAVSYCIVHAHERNVVFVHDDQAEVVAHGPDVIIQTMLEESSLGGTWLDDVAEASIEAMRAKHPDGPGR